MKIVFLYIRIEPKMNYLQYIRISSKQLQILQFLDIAPKNICKKLTMLKILGTCFRLYSFKKNQLFQSFYFIVFIANVLVLFLNFQKNQQWLIWKLSYQPRN